MPTTLREATRRARKQYRCGMCNTPIAVGEKHHVSTNLWDGRVYDWRECAGCGADNICAEVYYWAGYPDEGVDYESAWEWAHEMRDDAKAGEIARRFIDRGGCTCERCVTKEPEA